MAAISFQLAAVFQETTGGTAAQQAVTFTTPINPNQAQGAPAPQDTVTLTGQASQGQQAQQNPQQPQAFQGTVLVVAEAQVQVFAQGNADANNAQQTPEGQPTAQVPTPTQTQNAAVGSGCWERRQWWKCPNGRHEFCSRSCNNWIRPCSSWGSIRRASACSTVWRCCFTLTTRRRCSSSCSNCSRARKMSAKVTRWRPPRRL